MKPSTEIYDPDSGNRLPLALILALIAHGIIILGIGFTSLPHPSQEPVVSLNITLLEQPGGNPGPAASIVTNPITPTPVEHAPFQLPTAESPPPAEAIKPSPLITSHDALKTALPKLDRSTPPAEPAIDNSPSPAPVPNSPPKLSNNKPAPTTLSAIDLMNRGIQMARLDNAPQPDGNTREKRINQESMTTLEKFYMQAWERKVEQVGTLNFPEEARRLNQTNGPVLDVAIRADGSVHSIHLVRSSGYPALDNAARRIVALAAPYAAFPAELRRQYDILHIVRRWKFENGKLLP